MSVVYVSLHMVSTMNIIVGGGNGEDDGDVNVRRISSPWPSTISSVGAPPRRAAFLRSELVARFVRNL